MNLRENSKILNDDSHDIHASDEVAKREFSEKVGDNEGDKQDQLNKDVSNSIESLGAELISSDKESCNTNAERCHAICHTADQEMHKLCAKVRGYHLDEVDTDHFCKSMMETIFNQLAEPDHNKGHVSKEMIDNLSNIFITLAKLIVGMTSHEARDVVSLGTREMTETIKKAQLHHEPNTFFKDVMTRTHDFIGKACSKLRKWFTFGKHNGRTHGSRAYIDNINKLAGGARDFGTGIKNATHNHLNKIRDHLHSAKDSLNEKLATHAYNNLLAANPDRADEWVARNVRNTSAAA